MSEEGGRPKPPRTSRSGVDAVLKHVARPEKRSPLFWWLLEHHDELRQAQVESGLGMSWQILRMDFEEMGITAHGGKPVTAETARITWFRVRKEKKRIEERRARELAERDAQRAADPRRNMPSRFPKGAYGPPLATPRPQAAPTGARALLPPNERLPPEEQRARGLQLSTAAGVVVTKISRVFKLPETAEDFEFRENGIIRGGIRGWSSALEVKQEQNKRSGRPINDDTAVLYAKCGLEVEEL